MRTPSMTTDELCALFGVAKRMDHAGHVEATGRWPIPARCPKTRQATLLPERR